jgi:hypothetical protein
MIALNEAHSAHISSQVEDVVTSFTDLLTVVKNSEVYQVKFITELLFLQCEKTLLMCIVTEENS